MAERRRDTATCSVNSQLGQRDTLAIDSRPTGLWIFDMKPTKPVADTRSRLTSAMLVALQERGFHGVGLNELLKEAGGPKGVLYYHFPGGKSELAVASIALAITELTAMLDGAIVAKADPTVVLKSWMGAAQPASA